MDSEHILRCYLLRHAIAEKRDAGKYPDDDRPLTAEGVKKMKKAAKGIDSLGEDFEFILTSPMKRASQTAEIVKDALERQAEITVSKQLLPGASSQQISRLITKYKDQKSILLVGHEPDFSTFASSLLGLDDFAINLKKGGICRIDIPFGKTKGRGTLIWLLSPAILCMMKGKKSKVSA